ncbi:ABC transporter permease subunit [Nonomuraea endophytica]|uniref:ABC-2 type transport system permease protein n=1 Tax=Nonomuraea endophytica TaxID=714136 RepID=A0A7W7ZZI1_9ACTN|nr:ABC transporter permease subunit [Nonomuraea endophytica]MBB5076294.1 ABC-2 type transport system permease protein [Nonomuraea endophytica]
MIAKALGEYRRSLVGWSVGISLFLTMYVSIYASLREDPETLSKQALAKSPGALRDIMGGMEDVATGAGYLQTVVYQLLVPIMFIVCAMVLGNRAIAQPEESGTLELTITLPVDRRRLLLERYAAMVVALFVIAAITFGVLVAVAQSIDLGVGVDRILAAHTGVFLLAVFFGTVAVTVGAVTGRKAPAMAAVGVWAVAGYMVVTVGRNVEAISWLKWLSPFHYYGEGRPVYQGLPTWDYLVLAGAAVVLALTAVLAFDRRDVGV